MSTSSQGGSIPASQGEGWLMDRQQLRMATEVFYMGHWMSLAADLRSSIWAQVRKNPSKRMDSVLLHQVSGGPSVRKKTAASRSSD